MRRALVCDGTANPWLFCVQGWLTAKDNQVVSSPRTYVIKLDLETRHKVSYISVLVEGGQPCGKEPIQETAIRAGWLLLSG
jgi:hypothetical protein